MNIGERIKEIRKKEGFTQAQFAERIGSSQNTVARYETNQRMPSASVIALICKEFHVHEEWLRDGKGDVFVSDESLDAFLGQGDVTDKDRSLIKAFLKLDADARAEVIRFVEECAKELSAPADQPSSLDVVSRLAELEQQNQALAARLEAIEKEDKAARRAEEEWSFHSKPDGETGLLA